MVRPDLTTRLALADFNDFYWLKAELAAFCRTAGINASGGKTALAARIQGFLATGKAAMPPKPAAKAQSAFDWNNEPLSPATVITDNYKNTQNVRRFFASELGAGFSFNVKFMAWMRENTGKKLAEAVGEWQRLNEAAKDQRHQTDIAPQFEYNRYMRAFLADNPGLSSRDAMKCWKLKRAIRGTNAYEPTDLQLGAGEALGRATPLTP